MATKTNEQAILEMLAALKAEIAELKTGKSGGTGKAAKKERQAIIVQTAKTPSLAAVDKAVDKVAAGKCCGIVYPKKRDYENGRPLSILRCTQDAVTGSDRCKYHTADNATRHAAFQSLHTRMFPVWQDATKDGSDA